MVLVTSGPGAANAITVLPPMDSIPRCCRDQVLVADPGYDLPVRFLVFAPVVKHSLVKHPSGGFEEGVLPGLQRPLCRALLSICRRPLSGPAVRMHMPYPQDVSRSYNPTAQGHTAGRSNARCKAILAVKKAPVRRRRAISAGCEAELLSLAEQPAGNQQPDGIGLSPHPSLERRYARHARNL